MPHSKPQHDSKSSADTSTLTLAFVWTQILSEMASTAPKACGQPPQKKIQGKVVRVGYGRETRQISVPSWDGVESTKLEPGWDKPTEVLRHRRIPRAPQF